MCFIIQFSIGSYAISPPLAIPFSVLGQKERKSRQTGIPFHESARKDKLEVNAIAVYRCTNAMSSALAMASGSARLKQVRDRCLEGQCRCYLPLNCKNHFRQGKTPVSRCRIVGQSLGEGFCYCSSARRCWQFKGEDVMRPSNRVAVGAVFPLPT